jgi:hypothetical protein
MYFMASAKNDALNSADLLGMERLYERGLDVGARAPIESLSPEHNAPANKLDAKTPPSTQSDLEQSAIGQVADNNALAGYNGDDADVLEGLAQRQDVPDAAITAYFQEFSTAHGFVVMDRMNPMEEYESPSTLTDKASGLYDQSSALEDPSAVLNDASAPGHDALGFPLKDVNDAALVGAFSTGLDGLSPGLYHQSSGRNDEQP